MREICGPCLEGGFKICRFERVATDIASAVPPLDRQTPIKPDIGFNREPAAASMIIAKMREQAEKIGCPYSGDIYPNYAGRKNL